MMAEFQSKRDELTVGIFAPSQAILKRKDVGTILKNHFNETESLLKDKIDGFVELFRISHPDFYSSFKNARIVVHVVYHIKNGASETDEENEGDI